MARFHFLVHFFWFHRSSLFYKKHSERSESLSGGGEECCVLCCLLAPFPFLWVYMIGKVREDKRQDTTLRQKKTKDNT